MVTYADILIGLRTYIEETTGLPTVWRYPSYQKPASRNFYAIEFVNNGYTKDTKLTELVTESVYFNVANYASDVVALADNQRKLNDIMWNHTIPLINTDGEAIGSFNVSDVIGTTTINYGTHSEEESETIRSYTDIKVELTHIRQYK